MTQPKPSSSSFRYFVAGLKPLGRVSVWLPLGVIAVVALSLWQYSRHPEWLVDDSSANMGEPYDEVGNNLDIGVNLQDLAETTLDNPVDPNPFEPISPQLPNELPLNNPLGVPDDENAAMGDGLVDPLNQQPLNQGSSDNANSRRQPQFQPLIPSFKDLGSLFPSMAPSKNASQPIKIPDPEPLKLGTPQDNALKTALERVFAQETPVIESNPSPRESGEPSYSVQRQPQRNLQSPSSSRTPLPSLPSQPYSNPYGSLPTQPSFPTSTPSNPSPYQSPYNNPYTVSPPQAYSNPYGNGMAPAPIPAYPQPSQFGNNFNNPNPSVQQPPMRQPRYGMQSPQVTGYEGSYTY